MILAVVGINCTMDIIVSYSLDQRKGLACLKTKQNKSSSNQKKIQLRSHRQGKLSFLPPFLDFLHKYLITSLHFVNL